MMLSAARISTQFVFLTLLVCAPLQAFAQASPSGEDAAHELFPATIALPDGFQPEGVVVHGLRVLAGSLVDGDIYSASVVTGAGTRLVDAPEGRTAVGMDTNRFDQLFVCGATLGTAYVYDVASGAPLADYQLAAPETSLINDVIVTPDAAYFTDSWNPTLYRLPLGPGGFLPGADAVETIDLTGPIAEDFVPGEFNGNGIVYEPRTRSLLVVSSAAAMLYRVDPESGASERVDLGGEVLTGCDGLVLRGRTLYVMQNTINQIAVVRLNRRLSVGRIARVITDPRFQIPTTADLAGPYLFAVNARFDVAPPPLPGSPPADPTISFDVVRVPAVGHK